MSYEVVLDQPTALRALRAGVEKGRTAHAYLFVGPSGVGRKLTARIFAQSLNCEHPRAGEPCGECAACRLVEEGKHPDVQLIMPTKRSSTITVDQIEELLPFAYMRPLKGRNKVFVLSDADRLGAAAANKLLKTLEEPPPSTVFVLVTERPENVLPTVASRCQPIKFGRLRTESVSRILTRDFGVEPARAAFAAELADGQLTRALQFADPKRLDAVMNIVESLDSCPARMAAYDGVMEFLGEERASLAELAESKIPVSGEELTPAMKTSLEDMRKSFVDRRYREFLNDCLGLLLSFYRDLFVLKKTGDEGLVMNRDRLDLLRACAAGISVRSITENMRDIEEASRYCSHYVGEDRVFMDLLLRLRGE